VGHLAYNQFGANIGGPIKRNKVFFFANYLRTMDREANTNQTNIPSNAFRIGDLSGDPGHQVYDPTTRNQDGTGQNREPFPGNIIPASRIKPVSKRILAYLPPTNEPFVATSQTNDYFALLPFQKTTDQVDSKVDWNISDKDRLSGRFSFAKPRSFQAPIFGDAGGPAQGAFEDRASQKTYSTGLNYNRVISSTLLTEFRIGVAHLQRSLPVRLRKNDSPIGIPGVNPGPSPAALLESQLMVIPALRVLGQLAVGAPRPISLCQLMDQDAPIIKSWGAISAGSATICYRIDQPARSHYWRNQTTLVTCTNPGPPSSGADQVQRLGQRYGELLWMPSQLARDEYLLSRFSPMADFCMRPITGASRLISRKPGAALGICPPTPAFPADSPTTTLKE
jgi:hypothetical protein